MKFANKGFTLVSLMVVVVMVFTLGLLLVQGVVAYSMYSECVSENTKKSTCMKMVMREFGGRGYNVKMEDPNE